MVSPQYVTDNKGNKISVILPIDEYKKIIEELEELEDIRLYDESVLDKEQSLPIEQAFQFIEANRKPE